MLYFYQIYCFSLKRIELRKETETLLIKNKFLSLIKLKRIELRKETETLGFKISLKSLILIRRNDTLKGDGNLLEKVYIDEYYL